MRMVVIADSQFGNTLKLAEAVARGARATGAEVDVFSAEDADVDAMLAGRVDLIALGGPTVNRRATAPLQRCVDSLLPHGRGLAVATFDTRFRGAELLMGSAAKAAARSLAKAGVRLVVPPESFIVVRAEAPRGQRTPPGLSVLSEGEEMRAESWGRTLAETISPRDDSSS